MRSDRTTVVLSPGELEVTVESIERIQVASGMIPWFDGGHSDPWNHVEAAMALAVGGRHRAAERAYEWLRATQHENGSWFNYYWPDGSVEDARLDTNVCAYVAAGIWHHYLSTGDSGFVEAMFPMVEAAMTFVLSWQRPSGELVWSVKEDGSPESYALLTGSSSAYLSLRCAIACAELVGAERPEWELAAGRLRHAIVYRPDRFAPKARYAMDWYYPVLAGALGAGEASERLDGGWSTFVMDDYGVRCVSDRPWVTAAETAECALAYLGVGRADEAVRLLGWVQDQRDPDGSYTTGRVYPERSTFPHEERSTYTAAAIVLAFDALAGESRTSGLFLGEGLPAGLDLDEIDAAVTRQTTRASVNPS
ncbi:MAG: glycosyl hydrolase family 95 catalytic domain-containing protein [Acidimicrobiales bacterium]